jgi:hypothetical protein
MFIGGPFSGDDVISPKEAHGDDLLAQALAAMVIDGGPQVLKLASGGGLAHHARRPALLSGLQDFHACDVRIEGLTPGRSASTERAPPTRSFASPRKTSRPGVGERLGARVRTAEPDHMMACVDEFPNKTGTDEAGGTRQKYSHPAPLVWAGFRLLSPYRQHGRRFLVNHLRMRVFRSRSSERMGSVLPLCAVLSLNHVAAPWAASTPARGPPPGAIAGLPRRGGLARSEICPGYINRIAHLIDEALRCVARTRLINERLSRGISGDCHRLSTPKALAHASRYSSMSSLFYRPLPSRGHQLCYRWNAIALPFQL